MARRLSDQQRRRIAGQQQARREKLREQASEDALASGQLGAEQQALVVAHYGRNVEVELPDRSRHRCHLRANAEAIVTGDQVVVQLPESGDSVGVVSALLDRTSLLIRPDIRGKLRPVAANIDWMLITIAPRPEPFPFLIDRYLVAAEMFGIRAAILLNKTDLLAGLDETEQTMLAELIGRYRQIGYPVFELSSHLQHGLGEICAEIADATAVVVGQSGVGKSSLLKALLPGEEIAVGELSEGVDKGRHTTTTAKLYHIKTGGRLIDSPGIREFTLPPLAPAELAQYFVDLAPHTDNCHFRDCQHQSEPNCGLKLAEQQGLVLPERINSYRHILQTLSLED